MITLQSAPLRIFSRKLCRKHWPLVRSSYYKLSIKGLDYATLLNCCMGILIICLFSFLCQNSIILIILSYILKVFYTLFFSRYRYLLVLFLFVYFPKTVMNLIRPQSFNIIYF